MEAKAPLEDFAYAEKVLDEIVASGIQTQIYEIEALANDPSFNESKKKLLSLKKEELKSIKSYKDIALQRSVNDTVSELEKRGYEIDIRFAELCLEIEKYKLENSTNDVKEIAQYLNNKFEEDGTKHSLFSLSFQTAQAYTSISYTTWISLTTSEKLLVASNPSAAIATQAIQKKAYDFTKTKFGFNGLGDKSDGYRHGIWNALMTRDISRAWAEAFATAHEDKPKSVLDAKDVDGYTGWQHKTMDLDNNKVGRSVIAWYEYSFNCSDSTVKTRISNKLTNTSGNITWLHN